MNVVEERMRARLKAFKEEMEKKKAIEEKKPKPPPPSMSKEYQRKYQKRYLALKKEIKLSRMSEEEKIAYVQRECLGSDSSIKDFLKRWRKELKESLKDDTLSEFQVYVKHFMLDKIKQALSSDEKFKQYKNVLLSGYVSKNNLNA